MTETSKRCNKCKTEKCIEEFGKRNYFRKDGTQILQSECKICRAVIHKNYKNKNKKESRQKRIEEYNRNPEKYRQRSRDWRKENPERFKELSRRCREKKDRFVVALQNSERHARKYGYAACSATVEEIAGAFTGFCEICGVPQAECTGKLRLHHDHTDGQFVAWLCAKCNSGLGMFCDSEELLQKALNLQQDRKRIRR